MMKLIHSPVVPRLVALLLATTLGLAGCSDDDSDGDAAPPTTARSGDDDTTGADGNGNDDAEGEGEGEDAGEATGNPISDDVVIVVTGAFDQTFRGGACYVDEGILQVVAGYATGIGPNRVQDSPYANGTAFVIAQAMEGEQPTGSMVNVVRESDSEFLLAETPAIDIAPGLLTGTFEGSEASGSWSCPTILTAEQLQDLQADYIND
jgi:hypothetical protein